MASWTNLGCFGKQWPLATMARALYLKSIVSYLCKARAHFPASFSQMKVKYASGVIADHIDFNSVG